MGRRNKFRSASLVALAVAVGALSLAATSSASTALHLKRIGTSYGPLITDGVRWAAYQPTKSTTRVIDARTGHSLERADPAGCTVTGFGLNSGGLVAVGGGDLLYLCEDKGCKYPYEGCEIPGGFWSVRWVIESAATDVTTEITRVPRESGQGPVPTAVGATWLKVNEYFYRDGNRYFLDWHTGQTVHLSESPESVLDLNALSLVRPLCRPIVGIPIRPGGPEQEVLEPLYSPPFAVEDREVRQRGGPSAFGNEVALRRCASGKKERPSLTPHGVEGRMESAQLGGGVASWIAPGVNRFFVVMYVTRLKRTGREWHGPVYWLTGPRFPKGESEPVGTLVRGKWTLAHTSTTVYESDAIEEGHYNSARSAIFAARIP